MNKSSISESSRLIGKNFGEIYCWGSKNFYFEPYWLANIRTQINVEDNGRSSKDSIPKAYDFGLEFEYITCGEKHSAMLAQGSLYMIGENSDGRLGISKRSLKSCTVPVLVQAFSKHIVYRVSCGSNHTAAIIDTGELFTWGSGTDGQLGLGNQLSQYAPQLVNFSNNTTCVDVSCGRDFTGVVMKNGSLFTFGRGDCGQLGLGSKTSYFKPAKVELEDFIQKVSCGVNHTLIFGSDGLYSTGSNETGQLGLGHKKEKLLPSKIPTNPRLQILDIQAGYHSALLTFSGEVYIWGTTSLGQFLVPTRIAEELEDMIVDIKMGDIFTIMLDVQGKLWAFGNNAQGCLGMGEIQPSGIVEVKGIKNSKIKKLSCGSGFVIAAGGRILENNFTLRGTEEDKSYLSIQKVPIDDYLNDKKSDRSILEISSTDLVPKPQSPIKNSIMSQDSPSRNQDPSKFVLSPKSIGKRNNTLSNEIPKAFASPRDKPADSKLNLSNYTKTRATKLTLRDQKMVPEDNPSSFSTARAITTTTPRGLTPSRDDGIRKFYSPTAKAQLSASRIEHIPVTDISVNSNQNFLQLLSPSSSTARDGSVKRTSNLSHLKRQSGSKNNSYIEANPANDPFSDIPLVLLKPNFHNDNQDTPEKLNRSKLNIPQLYKPGSDGKETPLFPRSHGNSQHPTPRNLSEVPLIFLQPNNHNGDPFDTSHSRIDPLYSRNPSYISKSNSMSLLINQNRSSISTHQRNASEIYSNSPRGSASRGIRKFLEAEKYYIEVTEPTESSLRKKSSINQRGSVMRGDFNSSPIAARAQGSSPKYGSDHSLNLDELQGSGEKLRSPSNNLKDFHSPKSHKSDVLDAWEVSSIKDSPMHHLASSKSLTQKIQKQGEQGNLEHKNEVLSQRELRGKQNSGGNYIPSIELSMDPDHSHPMKIFDQIGHRPITGGRSSSPNFMDDRRTAAFNSPKAIQSPQEDTNQNAGNVQGLKNLVQPVNLLAGFENLKPSQKYFTKSPRTAFSPPKRESKGSRKNEELDITPEENFESAKKSKNQPFGSLSKVEEEPHSSPYFPKRQLAAGIAPIKIENFGKNHSRSPSNDFSFESSPIYKGTNKNSPTETRKPTINTIKSVKDLPDMTAVINQINELKAQNELLRKAISQRVKKLSELDERYKNLLGSKKKKGDTQETPEVKDALSSLEDKSKKQKLMNKKLAVEKEKLNVLEKDNRRLKDQGCEGVDAEKLIRENAALGELVRYIYELRALDMEKNVHKDTKAMVEARVNNLMKRLRIDNLGQIQKEVTPRGGVSAMNTSTEFEAGLENPFQIAPLQGVPVVETLTEGDGKGKLKLTFIKTLPKGSDTKRTEKDPDTVSSKSRDRSFQMSKSFSRNNPNSANRDLSDLQDSIDSPGTKSSNSPFESRQPTPKREALESEKSKSNSGASTKVKLSSSEKPSSKISKK